MCMNKYLGFDHSFVVQGDLFVQDFEQNYLNSSNLLYKAFLKFKSRTAKKTVLEKQFFRPKKSVFYQIKTQYD